MNNDFRGCRIQNTIAINELITMSEQHFSDGYFFKGESHNFYEAICVLEGTVGITAEKNVFILSAGQMTIHRPMEFHAIWEHNNSRPRCIIFSFSASAFPKIKSYVYSLSKKLVLDISELYRRSSNIFDIGGYTVSPDSVGTNYLTNGIMVLGIKEGMENESVRFVKAIEIFLLEALDCFSDIAVEYSDISGKNYARILEIMEKNIDKNLSMSELAELCDMSVSLLEKTIHKYLRCGTMTYYNNLRMNKAHSLLSNGESVKNTAFTLGCLNQNHFSASFKKHFGYPPSEVKNKYKSI